MFCSCGSVRLHYTISTYVAVSSVARRATISCYQHVRDTKTVSCRVHFYTKCTAIPWTVLYTHCLYYFNTSHQLPSSVTSTNSVRLLLLPADTPHLHVMHQHRTHKHYCTRDETHRYTHGNPTELLVILSRKHAQIMHQLDRLPRSSSFKVAIFLKRPRTPSINFIRHVLHTHLFHVKCLLRWYAGPIW